MSKNIAGVCCQTELALETTFVWNTIYLQNREYFVLEFIEVGPCHAEWCTGESCSSWDIF